MYITLVIELIQYFNVYFHASFLFVAYIWFGLFFVSCYCEHMHLARSRRELLYNSVVGHVCFVCFVGVCRQADLGGRFIIASNVLLQSVRPSVCLGSETVTQDSHASFRSPCARAWQALDGWRATPNPRHAPHTVAYVQDITARCSSTVFGGGVVMLLPPPSAASAAAAAELWKAWSV